MSRQTSQATIQAASAAYQIGIGGYGGVAVQLGGTFVATLVFEASMDLKTWFAVAMNPSTGANAASTATAPGLWFGPCPGAQAFRVRCSAFTSGVVEVTIAAADVAIAVVSPGTAAPDAPAESFVQTVPELQGTSAIADAMASPDEVPAPMDPDVAAEPIARGVVRMLREFGLISSEPEPERTRQAPPPPPEPTPRTPEQDAAERAAIEEQHRLAGERVNAWQTSPPQSRFGRLRRMFDR